MPPNKSSLTTLSNEALCRLRDEIAELLNSRAESLRKELDQLVGGVSTASSRESGKRRRRRSGTSRKVAPKYRGPNGETWAGRGIRPRWLAIAMNEGKQLEDFLIEAPKKSAYAKSFSGSKHHGPEARG
jgi:DNA-binding protein H-NS